MKLPKFLTTVTPFSKLMALSLFVTLPVLAFYYGMAYQKQEDSINTYIEPLLLRPTDAISTQSNEAVWKSYKDNDLGFTVKYPANWEVKTEVMTQQNNEYKIKFLEQNSNLWHGEFTITITGGQNIDTDKWAASYFRPLGVNPTTNLAKLQGKTTVDNNDAYKFLVFAFDRHETEIGLIRNDKLYIFTFTEETPNDPNLEEHKKIYNKILSTFHFSERAITPTQTEFKFPSSVTDCRRLKNHSGITIYANGCSYKAFESDNSIDYKKCLTQGGYKGTFYASGIDKDGAPISAENNYCEIRFSKQ